MRFQGAITRGVRLFNKNITFCKAAKLCIEGDACPVPVLQTPVQGSKELANGGSNNNSLKVAKYLAV